jgi:hypothetical protein
MPATEKQGLKPRQARLTTWAQAPTLAAGYFCHLPHGYSQGLALTCRAPSRAAALGALLGSLGRGDATRVVMVPGLVPDAPTLPQRVRPQPDTACAPADPAA